MITAGTKVAIMPGADYANRFTGQVGVVRKNYKDKIGVQIQGYNNPDSEYGVFWFKEKFLAVIPDSSILVDDAIKQVIFSGPKTIILWKMALKLLLLVVRATITISMLVSVLLSLRRCSALLPR